MWQISQTKFKGSIGEHEVCVNLLKRGYNVSIPIGDNLPYNLIVDRKGNLEKIQVKYTKSNGDVITCRCSSNNGRRSRAYTKKDIDWLAIYDATTDNCYYIKSKYLKLDSIKLRTTKPKNNQTKKIRFAWNYTEI